MNNIVAPLVQEVIRRQEKVENIDKALDELEQGTVSDKTRILAAQALVKQRQKESELLASSGRMLQEL